MRSRLPISLRRPSASHWRRRGATGSRRTFRVYAGLFAASLALLTFDVSGHPFADATRRAVTDLASPLLGAFSGGTLVVKSWVAETRTLAHLSEEIDRLRAENRELREWRRRARELEGRARSYEALLNLQPDPSIGVITARAIADAHTPFDRSLIINAGREAGVVEGHAVLGAEGFIGRVVAAGERSARVLLVNDLESRIPVLVGLGRHRAIMAGTNEDEPTLLHVPAGAKLEHGDLVVTSGEGRLLPPDVPVGEVRLAEDGGISVALASDPALVEFVRVLDYGVTVDVAAGEPPLPPAFAGTADIAGALVAPVVQVTGAADAAAPAPQQ